MPRLRQGEDEGGIDVLTVSYVGFCGCKFCWRCGFARRECGCPPTSMVVDPNAVNVATKEGERLDEVGGGRSVCLAVESELFDGASSG